jgi:hypothetical protein
MARVPRVFFRPLFASFWIGIWWFSASCPAQSRRPDHETVDNTVENGVVVETFAAVIQEVFNCFRRFVVKRFDYDIAMISVESNHFCILFR